MSEETGNLSQSSGPAARGQLTYSRYLRVDELIRLQQPLVKPEVHDEMLFIVIHQVYELWFKQVLHELDSLIGLIQKREFIPCLRRLNRVSQIFRTLIDQVDILETMTPVEFNRFRSVLNPASGFQSLQFRELEILGGLDAQEYRKFFDFEPEWRNKLAERLAKPTLRQAFFQLLVDEKLVPVTRAEDPEARSQAILSIYLDDQPDSALRSLCEGLLQLDEQLGLWRFRHVQMVERMIGMKGGTGGSLGVGYLRGTLRKRFFPELWECRTYLNGN